MNELEQIIAAITTFSMTTNFGEAIYRIITEKDCNRSWKERAITCIICGIIDMILLLVMKLSGWW